MDTKINIICNNFNEPILKSLNDDLKIKIIDFFEKKIIDDFEENKHYLNIIGAYYFVIDDYEKAEKFFEKAIKNGNLSSANRLGIMYHYYYVNKDKMLLNYLKAIIENKDIKAMKGLGNYYGENGNFEEMRRFYQLAKDEESKKIEEKSLSNQIFIYGFPNKNY